MGNLSKLEIVMGTACLVFILLGIYFIYIPLSNGIAEQRSEPPHLYWLWSHLLPGVLVTIAASFHAIKKSYIALSFVLIGAGWIFFLTALAALLGHAFEGHPWIGLSPGIFAFVTMVVAVANTVYFIRKDGSALGTDTNTNLTPSHRLELFFGASALIVAVVRVFIELFSQPDTKGVIVPIFLSVFLAPFLTALGAYLQTLRQNDLGLAFIFGGFIIAIFLELFVGRGFLANGLYVDMPYLLIFITTIFALNSLRVKYKFF